MDPLRRSDIRMIGQALGNRWPIPAGTRDTVVAALMDVLETSPDARAKVAAAKVIVQADKLNLEDEKRADPGKELKATLSLTAGGLSTLTPESARAMTDEQLNELVRLGAVLNGS